MRVLSYVGRTFRGKVVRTVLRGSTVFREGKIVSEPMGRLVRPGPSRERSVEA